MLAPKTRPGGVPHRLLGVIFDVFEVLIGLGRSGRGLRAVLLGRPLRALERLWGGLQRSVGGSWRGLGCHAGAQDGSESTKNRKKVWLQEAGGSGVVF